MTPGPDISPRLPLLGPRGGVEIRPLRGAAEYEACLAMQRDTWGDAPGTLVPTALLIVAQRIGGIAAGAFDAEGRLLGFVFGLTGVMDGVLVHWSDMLAVRPDARDRGIGRMLKHYQRDQMARLGVRTIYWTFDPLVAKNARLNLVVLGGRVAEYVEDMYGDTGSPVHAGLGTDRIIVAWDIGGAPASGDVEAGAATPRRASRSRAKPQVLNAGGGAFTEPGGEPARVRIEIPADIFAVRERSPDEARAWRASSRAAFQWALAHGYRVVDVARGEGETASYVLERAGGGA